MPEPVALTVEMTLVFAVLAAAVFLFISEIVRVDVAAVLLHDLGVDHDGGLDAAHGVGRVDRRLHAFLAEGKAGLQVAEDAILLPSRPLP